MRQLMPQPWKHPKTSVRQTSYGQAGNYGQPQHEEACARQNSASQTGCFASAAALLIGASKYPVAQR
jgi:hypothetical protein